MADEGAARDEAGWPMPGFNFLGEVGDGIAAGSARSAGSTAACTRSSGAWPTKPSGSGLGGDGNGIAIETLELACDRVEETAP